MGKVGSLALGALVVVLPGCLLFTGRINHAPEVVSVTGPEDVVRGETATFRAQVNDPDQAPATLLLSWYRARGQAACPATLEAAQAGVAIQQERGVEATFAVSVDFLESYCVWVVASDDDGATGFGTRLVKLSNREPQARLEVASPSGAGPYPLFSGFRLSAGGSVDPDGDAIAEHLWTLTGPDGQPRSPEPCGAAPDQTREICFVADQQGDWKVALRVRDGLGKDGQEATATLTVAPDSPPCIELTDPPFDIGKIKREASRATSFELKSVKDDGDGYPLSLGPNPTHKVSWRWRRNALPEDNRFPRQLESAPFPAGHFNPGDTVVVRATYDDRVPRDHGPCLDGNEPCALPAGSPACYQSVVWTVEFY